MALTDMIVSALLKKGILYEARNVNVKLDLPKTAEQIANHEEALVITITADHMTLKIEKDDK